MPLIDEVATVCAQLSQYGWSDLLKRVCGLNINAADLKMELARKLDDIDRTAAGFDDFAIEGSRAIEPGKPAQSLLYHALASPGVISPLVKKYPDPGQLEIIENYVYAARFPSIADLRQQANGAPLAIVVYASEYRTASETVHRKHADVCFSRTGVARIGTEDAAYVNEARGYTANASERSGVRVVPCSYSAYIAVQMNGNPGRFGPLRPRGAGSVDTTGAPVTADAERLFWVPLHKLFPGSECIRGLKQPIDLRFFAEHRNEKLRRIHLYLLRHGIDSGFSEPDLSRPPFVMTDRDLADRQATAGGSGLRVIPKPHPLVEEAKDSRGKRIGFPVPPAGAVAGAAFHIPPEQNLGRSAPELVYIRQQIESCGSLKDLNTSPNLTDIVFQGNYLAQHYVDYSGDGYVAVECKHLLDQIAQQLPAYSILAAPDFFPVVKQREVFDWWQQSVPPELRQSLFLKFTNPIAPEPLSDARVTANITYRRASTFVSSVPVFQSRDDSYTAVVSLLDSANGSGCVPLMNNDDARVSPLPDGAAGYMSPGWDISVDFNPDENSPKGVLHLAAYGCGSPFIEDARLCAAQSACWPAVAPDTTRLYEPTIFPTVTPIPDSRLGWDGVPGPRVNKHHSVFNVASLAYTDYVLTAQHKKFDFARIFSTTTEEYQLWTTLMLRIYQAIGQVESSTKPLFALLEFDIADKSDPDLVEAQNRTHRTLSEPYKFYLARTAIGIQETTRTDLKEFLLQEEHRCPPNPGRVYVRYARSISGFVTPPCALMNDTLAPGWKARDF